MSARPPKKAAIVAAVASVGGLLMTVAQHAAEVHQTLAPVLKLPVWVGPAIGVAGILGQMLTDAVHKKQPAR